MIPQIHHVRFRSAIDSAKALQANMPKIRHLILTPGPDSELADELKINSIVLDEICAIGDLIERKIDQFEKSNSCVYDSIPALLEIIEWSLQSIEMDSW